MTNRLKLKNHLPNHLSRTNRPMKDAKERRIAELERQVLALNTLIDIAEEQGIQVRKKSVPHPEIS